MIAEAASLASFDVEGFDDIVRGGLPRGRLYLLKGRPGVGKTTLALQFLLGGAKAGERGLYITLSETREELEQVARSHGWDISSLNLFELNAAEAQHFTDEQYTMYQPSEIELNEAMRTLLAEVERVNPDRVVFDSLSEIRRFAHQPPGARHEMIGWQPWRTPAITAEAVNGARGRRRCPAPRAPSWSALRA